MPFARPTLSELRRQVSADIAADLPELLRFSNAAVVGDVQAGLTNGLYGYLDWIAKQSVPFTATDEYLEAWAILKGVTRKPAAFAAGTVTLSGANGAIVPAGTPIIGREKWPYVTSADGTIASGSVSVPIIAVAAGAGGNADMGAAVSIAEAVAGVSGAGTVAAALSDGADLESDDSLRSRMLQVYAAPPQGGDADDYVEWTRAIPGVTRAWAMPLAMGAGTVVVYFMMDDARVDYQGFPQGTDGVAAAEDRDTAASGDQLDVADALFVDQPVTALVYAVAPAANQISLTIAGIADASTTVRGRIAEAARAGLDLGARPGGRTNISAIEGAIAGVLGAEGFVITAITASHGSVTPGAAGNIISDTGYLPILNGIAYV